MSAAQFATANPSPADDRLTRERLPRVGLTLRRNCSLSPRAALAIVAAAAFVLLGIGAAFAWLGLWLVLPFAGIEIAALALAFYLNGRHAGDYERFVFGRAGRVFDGRGAQRGQGSDLRVQPALGESGVARYPVE